MSLIPLRIELTPSWQEINDDIFNVFSDSDNVDFYFRLYDSKEFEILVDQSGVVVIDDTYNGKGLLIDQNYNIASFTLNKDYKYYARTTEGVNVTINIRPKAEVTTNALTGDELYNSGLQAPFNRIRVVQAQKLFDNQLQYDGQPVFWDEKIVGNAFGTLDPYNSAIDLTVVDDGDLYLRQLKEYVRYQSGNGQVIKMTFTPDVNSDEIEFVLRTTSGAFDGSTKGIPFDLVIPRSEWNYDKLDGNGPSRINLNLDKSQIFLPDLEWLSTGTVRLGFDIAGKFRACHFIHNANEIRGAYMTTANLPASHLIKRVGNNIIQEIGYGDSKNGVLLRYIANNQTTGTLKQICTAIESEGGLEEEAGYPFSGGAGAASITLTPGASFIAVAQHQLLFNGIENRAKYIPQQANIATTDSPVFVEFIYNPTVADGVFVPVVGDIFNSIMERNVTATSLTGGNVIFEDTILASSGQGSGQASNAGSNKTTLVSKLPFGIGIDADAPIPFAVRITNIGSVDTDMYYNFNWKEIR